MRRSPLVALRLAALGAALALPGCLGGILSDRDRLKTAIEEYNEGLRWGKVDQCAVHLPVERRQPFAEGFAALGDDLEVVEYEVQRLSWDRARNTADVRLSVSWSLKRRGLVERTVVEQHWEEVRTAWYVTRSKRLSGSPLPILEDVGVAARVEPTRRP